ncbi:hypothetical protein GWK47_030206 [Chionoecetes opilio]|uniref:Uncharacterized protein n=1 Tax=Chionoecetes opilio TaxID=41210 RepID=A0A8J5D1P6_CHIOP|nr:hypothetical protein GWK47_030206 [Chionoecetes opilio]
MIVSIPLDGAGEERACTALQRWSATLATRAAGAGRDHRGGTEGSLAPIQCLSMTLVVHFARFTTELLRLVFNIEILKLNTNIRMQVRSCKLTRGNAGSVSLHANQRCGASASGPRFAPTRPLAA